MAEPKKPQQVTVIRTDLPSPDVTDPNRVVVQIQYQVGSLPPRFLYIDKKSWNAETEKKMIKADMDKQLQPPGETITV